MWTEGAVCSGGWRRRVREGPEVGFRAKRNEGQRQRPGGQGRGQGQGLAGQKQGAPRGPVEVALQAPYQRGEGVLLLVRDGTLAGRGG